MSLIKLAVEQITLPEENRQHLKLNSGIRVEFLIDEDGQVIFFA